MEEIREQLKRVAGSAAFARARRSAALLQFLVEQTLAGKADGIKEYVVGVQVFERGESFDPRIDSIVRVEANRLRKRLREYYENEGLTDAVIIDLPPGAYIPVFRPREAAVAEPPRTRGSDWLIPLVLAATLLLVGSFWVYNSRRLAAKSPLASPVRRLTQDSGLTAYPAFFPDGQTIAYASDRADSRYLRLWSQRLDTGAARMLTDARSDDSEPTVSPDGKWIAFRSERLRGGVYLMPSEGGPQRLLAPFGRGPRFSPDGTLLSFWVPDPLTSFGKVFTVPLDPNQEPQRIASDFDDAHSPAWTPDGRNLIICGTRRSGSPGQEHDFWIVSLDGSRATHTGAFPLLAAQKVSPHILALPFSSFRWLSPTTLAFSAESPENIGLWTIPLDPVAAHAEGAPHPLTLATTYQMHPAVHGKSVVYTDAQVSTQVWSLPINAEDGRVLGEPQMLTREGQENVQPSISADGRKLVYLSRRAGELRLWSRDLPSGREEAVPGISGPSNRAKITSSGDQIFYRLMEGAGKQKQPIYRTDLKTGVTLMVCSDCGAITHVSPNGRHVLYETPSAVSRIGIVPVDTGQKTEALRHSHHGVQSARFSPDGAWIAFQLNRGPDGRQIFLAPLRPNASTPEPDWIPVTAPGNIDQEPWWSPGGRVLYFLSNRDGFRCVWAQKISPQSHQPEGEAFAVAHFHEVRLNPLTLLRRAPFYIGLSISSDRLVLSLADSTASIWLASITN